MCNILCICATVFNTYNQVQGLLLNKKENSLLRTTDILEIIAINGTIRYYI